MLNMCDAPCRSCIGIQRRTNGEAPCQHHICVIAADLVSYVLWSRAAEVVLLITGSSSSMGLQRLVTRVALITV